MKIYPGAGHSFMNQHGGLMGKLSGLSPMKVGYDPEAAEDSWRRIEAFFGQYLEGARGSRSAGSRQSGMGSTLHARMDTGPRTLEIPNPDAWFRSMRATGLVAIVGYAGAAALLINDSELMPGWAWPVALVSPLLLVFFTYFHGPLRRRVVRLRRAGTRVVGAPGGPLVAGEGRIVVERKLGGSGHDVSYVYRVRHEGPGRSRLLFRAGFHPTEVRACAEGLCRVGGWDMVWKSDEGDEVRTPAELDQPLLARLAAEQGVLGAERPLRARVATTAGRGGALEIGSGHLGLMTYPVTFAVLTLGFTVFGGGPVALTWAALRLPMLGAAAALAVLFVGDLLLGFPVEVSPAGVRMRTEVLGLTVRDRFLATDGLESLYVERGRRYHRLVFAGDGIHRAAGRYGSLEQATAARRQVVRALLGR